MKKLLRIFLYVAAFVAVVILALIVFTDTAFQQRNTVTVNAPKEKVWPYLSSMRAVNSWIPWMKTNPEMSERYEGTSGAVGDTFIWESKVNPSVKMKEVIEEIVPFEKTRIKVRDVTGTEMFVVFELNQKGSATEISWVYEEELSATRKIQKPFMQKKMAESAELALQNLKSTVEHSK